MIADTSAADVGKGRAAMLWRSVFSVLALAGWSICAGLTSASTAHAQGTDDIVTSSYITPFPENDTYRMLVIGDAFAEGILFGLSETIGPENGIELSKRHRNFTGITRDVYDDEIRALDEALAKEPPHIVVAMVGAYDRSPIRMPNGRRALVGTPEWIEGYGQRIDRMMKLLRRKRAAVYWVSLPVMRRPEWNDDVQVMNDIMREKAFLNGLRFIDAYAGFVDDSGNYDNYGPDLTGKQRRMREGDGILFTADGNRKLAHFVERELKRDLGTARSERTITLLGAEPEQARITPKPAAGTAARASTAIGEFRTVVTPQPAVAGSAAQAASSGVDEQKADTSRITARFPGSQGREETITLDLPRPAIPANVMALVARQQSPDRPAQLGETLTDEIAGGLVVLSSISTSAGSSRRRLSPTQTPYFRVVVKGERLPSKPGRADDFSWPRVEQKTDVTPVPVAPAGRVLRGNVTPPRT